MFYYQTSNKYNKQINKNQMQFLIYFVHNALIKTKQIVLETIVSLIRDQNIIYFDVIWKK